MTTVLRGVHAVNASINKVIVDHKKAMQKGIASAMVKTRLRAAKYLIPNTTSFKNPYKARKEQASTPGRLTSRTGKLKYMLEGKRIDLQPLRRWKGLGNKLYKERTPGLLGQVRTIKTAKNYYSFEGTYRVKISNDQRLFSTRSKMPQESTRTLAIRFNWETGIRGKSRPIFSPVIKSAEFDFRDEVKRKNEKIWSLK
jgi:hypothetical protein